MNLEARLTDSLNDVLRTSGYIFEIINNNKKQSNFITGPNSLLIPAPVTSQLAQNVAQFDLILDETISKFNDARWCIEQIVENKQKQEEMKIQEELERQKKVEAERKRKEEEETARKRRELQEKEKLEREEAEREARQKQERERKEAQERQTAMSAESELDTGFDFNLDLGKAGLDIPNPSDILLSISYKDGFTDNNEKGNKKPNMDDGDMDLNNVLGGGQALLDDLSMGLLDQEFDSGMGNAEEEFDVDNFLNQFGNGD